MNHVHPIFGQNGSARRGACPTLDAPMQTGDGLLARIRVAGGALTPTQLAGLAALAEAHGNGLVEITARGNLQVRGLRPDSAPELARAAAEQIEVETGLGVDISPIAGIDPQEQASSGPLARAIRAGAAAFAGRLGPKVSVVIDGGGQISLARLKADIRLTARGNGRWGVTLGGGRPQEMGEAGAISAALALLGALAALGPAARATDLFPNHADGSGEPPSPASLTRMGAERRLELTEGHTSPIALPYGQMDASALIALAERASEAGVDTIRLAPDHTLLLDNAPDALIQHAARLGFITDPADPRRRISACIGNPGCASGHIAARRIAERLAAQWPGQHHLHVSGCAKGCAHPRRAEVTLVGRADGIGLVIDGRAGDTPERILDEAALADALSTHQVGR